MIPIASALGSVEFAELPEFHSFRGADITGSFSGKGKLSCWKTFMDADEDTITLEPHCGRDIGPCRDVYMPALSGWSRYLTSQRTKMAYAHKKSDGIG